VKNVVECIDDLLGVFGIVTLKNLLAPEFRKVDRAFEAII
jgi:hypothetical protein